MVDGKKRVERIPDEWVEEIRPLVEQGREFKDAVAEVFGANAQLLALWRRQSMKRKPKKK
jgi:transposase-like protein